MSYEQNSKLYPDYKAGEGPQYHNDDSFFYFWSPEELREFLTEENISDVTIYKNIGNKKVPFFKGLGALTGNCGGATFCGDPNCYSLAHNFEGHLQFGFPYCQLLEEKNTEYERLKEQYSSNELCNLSDDNIREKANKLIQAQYDRNILEYVAEDEVLSGAQIWKKLSHAKPSSLYRNPFEGFDASDKPASPIKWTVKDIIPQASISSIFGSPDSGKTFLALELALRVATGTAFNGKEVDQGSVLYLAPEGSTGLPIRRDAWLKENGWFGHFIPFYLRGNAFSFSSQEDRDYLANTLSFVTERWAPRLVVFDTLGQSLGCYDENSASDMNLIARYLNDLKIHHSCSFLLVDHSGHESKRARGSSAKRGAWDAEFFVSRKDDLITVKNTKMKDAPTAKDFTMQLVQSHNSLVLKETKTASTHVDVLRDLIEKNPCYDETQIRQTFYETCAAKTPEARQKAFQRSLDKLVRQGIVSKLTSDGETKLALKTKAGQTPPLL